MWWSTEQLMFLGLHFTGLCIPVLLALYGVFTFLEMFIPLMGRTGSTIHPDIFQAVFLAFVVLMLFGYQVRNIIFYKGEETVVYFTRMCVTSQVSPCGYVSLLTWPLLQAKLQVTPGHVSLTVQKW